MFIKQGGAAETGTVGKTITVTYYVFEAANESVVRAGIRALIPTSYDGYPLAKDGVSVKGIVGNKVFEVSADYEITEKDTIPETTWNFESGSGQYVLTVSDDTTVYNLDTDKWAVPDDVKHLIGYDKENGEIKGVTLPDIGDAASRSVTVYTKIKPNLEAYFTKKYRVNSSAWGEHPENSALYMGSSVSYDKATKIYTLTHNFAVGENRTDISIGGISGISKNAFDVIDCVYNKVDGSESKIDKLTNIKVHNVYNNRRVDFNALFGVKPDGTTAS